MTERDATYGQLLDALPGMVWEADREGVLTSVSPRCRDLLGYAPEELVGRSIFELKPVLEAVSFRTLWESSVTRRAPLTALATTLTRKDGRTIWVETNAVPVTDELGGLRGYQGADLPIPAADLPSAELSGTELSALAPVGPHQLLQSIVDNYPGTVFWKDREGVYLGCNRAHARSIGRSDPSEVVGKSAHDLAVTRPGAQDYQTAQRKGMESERELSEVRALPLADGRTGWFDVSLVPLRDTAGRVVGVLGAFHDVTVHRQTEEDLARERDFIDAVLQTEAAAVIVLDDQGRVVRFNRIAEQLTGYSLAEIAGRRFGDVVASSEEATWSAAAFAELLAGKGPLRGVNYWRTKAGGRRLIAFSNTVLRDAGLPKFVVATGIDITGQRQAEADLERLLLEVGRRAAELESVLDNMVDGVFAVDPAGGLTLINEAGMRMLDVADEQEAKSALGRPEQLVSCRRMDGTPIPSEDRPIARAVRGEVIRFHDMLAHSLRSGRDWIVRISAAPMRSPQGQIIGAVAVARDITEMAELDRMKDEFIRLAANELKTPVAIMKGYAKVLLRGAGAVPLPQRRSLDAIGRGSERLDELVRDLLDVTRLQLGQLVLARDRVDVSELAQQVVTRFAGQTTGHRITLVAAEPVTVLGDLERLGQVMSQLLENAIKYSPRGGAIEVVVAAAAGEVEISVADRGIGIPRERQGHIFERFYRAHTGTPFDYGGLGVGLFIAREIVRGHAGRIWFESEEGVGSTFHVILPARA